MLAVDCRAITSDRTMERCMCLQPRPATLDAPRSYDSSKSSCKKTQYRRHDQGERIATFSLFAPLSGPQVQLFYAHSLPKGLDGLSLHDLAFAD
jgi:hypothetical protein